MKLFANIQRNNSAHRKLRIWISNHTTHKYLKTMYQQRNSHMLAYKNTITAKETFKAHWWENENIAPCNVQGNRQSLKEQFSHWNWTEILTNSGCKKLIQLELKELKYTVSSHRSKIQYENSTISVILKRKNLASRRMKCQREANEWNTM